MSRTPIRPGSKSPDFQVLVVEDNEADAHLALEALRETGLRHRSQVLVDGVEAVDHLRRSVVEHGGLYLPHLVFLDLNLPRKDGRQVLREIKGDETLRSIPVIVLSSSESEADVRSSYQLHANAYLTKRLDLKSFFAVMRDTVRFWLRRAELPPR